MISMIQERMRGKKPDHSHHGYQRHSTISNAKAVAKGHTKHHWRSQRDRLIHSYGRHANLCTHLWCYIKSQYHEKKGDMSLFHFISGGKTFKKAGRNEAGRTRLVSDILFYSQTYSQISFHVETVRCEQQLSYLLSVQGKVSLPQRRQAWRSEVSPRTSFLPIGVLLMSLTNIGYQDRSLWH